MHDPVRQTGNGSSRLCRVLPLLCGYRGKHRQSQRIPGSVNWDWCITSPPKSENAGSPGHVWSLWLTDGSSTACTPSLSRGFASPPVIHDKNRCANEPPVRSARGYHVSGIPTAIQLVLVYEVSGVPGVFDYARTGPEIHIIASVHIACRGMFRYDWRGRRSVQLEPFRRGVAVRNSIFQKSEKISGIENV